MRSYLGLAMIALMGLMSASGAMANKDGWVTAGANTKTRADAVIASAGAADPMVSNAETTVTNHVVDYETATYTWAIVAGICGILAVILLIVLIVMSAYNTKKNKSIYSKVKYLNNGNGSSRRR